MKTFCSYFNQGICHSCDLITLDYPDQIKYKENQLRASLQGLQLPALLPSIHSPTQHFRNKVKLVVTGTTENPIIGLWGEDKLDSGRELLNCPLHVEETNDLLPAIKEFITLATLAPYNIEKKAGELKGIIIFHSKDSQESYLRFILRSKESIDRIKKHSDFLFQRFSHLKSLSVNIQPVPHAVLEGETEIFISNHPSILHKMGEVSFSLGPKAFVQTNQTVALKLYETAAEWVKEAGLSTFMELFCGQGAFSFFSAPYIKKGLGIEINAEAIEEANKTCKKFNFDHLKFKSADAGKVQEEIDEFSPDIILVNPPRRGLGEASDLLLKSKPGMIIYSSCNHKTLSDDLKKLSSLYRIEKIQIFDMFPHSSHFETLVQLKLSLAG